MAARVPVPYSKRTGGRFCLTLPQVLRRHSQRAIELTRSILPGNRRRYFDDRVVVVELAQTRKEFITHIAACDRDRVGVFKRHAFSLVVQRARSVFRQHFDLFVRQSQLAADRSVDVLSKLAAVEGRYTPVD